MSELLNIAIIGAGIGKAHLAAYLHLPEQFVVRTVCDIDEARAAEIIAETGADTARTKVETEFDKVLADERVDIVDICLPPHLHFSMSKAALEAGKHVVCEKPLVSSLADADKLAEVAKANNRILTPVFQYRYGTEITKLKALVAAGLTGKPLVASVETHWNRPAEYYANPWRGTWKGEQGGAVLGHAIHNHDLLCAIFGPINKVQAFLATRVNDIEVEDCAAISFQMTNGSVANSSVTLGANDDTTRFRFVFENLTAESGLLPYTPAKGAWTFDVRGSAHSQNEIDAVLANVPEARPGFAGLFQAMADRLQRGGEDAVTLEDGRRSLELVTAIYESARQERVISLPLKESCGLYESWLP